MSPLEGEIIHRIELDSSSISRKRKRDEKPWHTNSLESRLISSGFIFVSNNASHTTTYLLSLPQRLLNKACHAALCKAKVIVTHYHLIALELKGHNANKHWSYPMLLEIQEDGLEICEDRNTSAKMTTTQSIKDDVWTLTQFRCLERMNRNWKDKRFNIKATMDAVSPIIASDPNNPFALIELYDQDAEESSAVLYLNTKRDLIYHTAMLPGDTITFHQLRRKPWSVPKWLQKKKYFQHLNGRIPSHIFVTTEESHFCWHNESKTSQIPPTLLPLVSLEGKIGHLETLSKRDEAKSTEKETQFVETLHFVEVFDSKEENLICRLYLSHFPMSTTLQLGIRKGATIRAVNVHKVCEPSFVTENLLVLGTCLRSTITIIKTASEHFHAKSSAQSDDISEQDTHNSGSQDSGISFATQPTEILEPKRLSFIPNLKPRETLQINGVLVSYPFHKIKVSYLEDIYQSHVKDWIKSNFFELNMPSTSFVRALIPSVSEFVDIIKNEERLKLDLEESVDAWSASCSRNYCAEFFDHGVEDLEAKAVSKDSCGCELSRKGLMHRLNVGFTGLQQIRESALRLFSNKFAKRIVHNKTFLRSGGWTGSMYFECNDLVADIRRQAGNDSVTMEDNLKLYTGGIISEVHKDGKTPGCILDKNCQIPVNFTRPTATDEGDFLVGDIKNIILSCLCIFQPKSKADLESQQASNVYTQEEWLPPINTSHLTERYLKGGCSLLRIDGFVLIVSVQLCCEGSPKVFSANANGMYDSSLSEPSYTIPNGSGATSTEHSIEEALVCDQSLATTPDSHTVRGLLLRQRFSHSKWANDVCKCCVLTLCSIPEGIGEKLDEKQVCHLQSMNLKLAITCSASSLNIFKKAIAMVSAGLAIVEDQCTLGASWWALADSGRTCSLISGGWDELDKDSPIRETGVEVSLPSSAMHLDKRGYVRFSCKSDQIQAKLIKLMTISRLPKGAIATCFDFIGGKKFLDGMLSHRPQRRLVFGPNQRIRMIGELIESSSSGIQNVKICDLYRLVCQSFQAKFKLRLAPSLVRKLSGAKFLGVSFCKVECICKSCFKALKASTSSRQGKNGPTFWHLPHPDEETRKETISVQSFTFSQALLECPSNCPQMAYEVNWECSGLVDDGTGQAKLFADREAALTLLGLDSQAIEWIEEGVKSIGTISFSKTTPPSNELIKEVNSVSLEKNPLERLSPSIRAEYLLHHHCGSLPDRQLDYFVRCKPLSDDLKYLSHTQAESFFSTDHSASSESSLAFQRITSYTLPQLKLELVDCAVASYENQLKV